MAAVAVEEIGGDAAFVLAEGPEPVAGMDARRAETRPHRVVNDALQPAAVDGELRHVVAGVGAARLAPDLLAEAVGIDELVGPDRHGIETLEQAERRELLDRMGQRIDADAELADAFGLLVDLAVDAARVQHQRSGEAANSATDDNDLHEPTPRTGTPLLVSRLITVNADRASASVAIG